MREVPIFNIGKISLPISKSGISASQNTSISNEVVRLSAGEVAPSARVWHVSARRVQNRGGAYQQDGDAYSKKTALICKKSGANQEDGGTYQQNRRHPYSRKQDGQHKRDGRLLSSRVRFLSGSMAAPSSNRA